MKEFLELCSLPNPLENPPWSNCATISISEVLSVPEEKLISPEKAQRNQWATREEHICRIAYLVKNKDSRPITFHSRKVRWPIKDGNHRLAAAIVRGDTFIAANYL